ncbi:hypothetical protein P171DRAFT_472707 [Karstenula rhodostoma CBS 690.94]|uniref:DUF7730 domain-containing protein n=1 Tax=Karstenula rhodostoma CBS 690.94 TaxID=1392251 RepID=A0A9P4UCT0_9PLEO|nr:hypothetical protein P171DRAFT_472707 [Karstenula rhodostoma CBS 690.94]
MAPKNKRKSSASGPVGKKLKSQPTTSTLTDPPTPHLKHQRLHPEAISLYNENAQTPLLGLPREIRDQIWTYLCGNLVLHPTKNNTSARRVHPLTFNICGAPQTPKVLYELSLQGASSDPSVSEDNRAVTWAAPALQGHDFYVASYRPCTGGHGRLTAELKVPIVCRQMWDEMSETVYETCTFAFTSSNNFFHFLSCRKAGLERVRRVLLGPGISAPLYTDSLDLSDFNWWNLKRLKGVRSLDLWIEWQLGLEYKRVKVGGAQWMEKKGSELEAHWRRLQSMVKLLKRWDLKSELTRVIVDVRGGWADGSVWVQYFHEIQMQRIGNIFFHIDSLHMADPGFTQQTNNDLIDVVIHTDPSRKTTPGPVTGPYNDPDVSIHQRCLA